MSNKIWLAALILSLLPLCACGQAPETVTVTSVIDGDTIVIDTGQKVLLLSTPARR